MCIRDSTIRIHAENLSDIANACGVTAYVVGIVAAAIFYETFSELSVSLASRCQLAIDYGIGHGADQVS